MPFVLLESSQWARSNGIYFVSLEPKCKRYRIEVIFPLNFQIKLQKTRLWKEKTVQNMITLAGLPINSRLIFFIFNSSEIEFVPCKIRFIF